MNLLLLLAGLPTSVVRVHLSRLADIALSPDFGTFLGKLDPVAADALEQSVLESKDREQLVAIASALGVKLSLIHISEPTRPY